MTTNRPVMPDGSLMTWSERVRLERPDAPQWLVDWAKTMDDLDRLEESIHRTQADIYELMVGRK